MHRRARSTAIGLGAIALAVLLPVVGCGLDIPYLLGAGLGQVNLMLNSETVTDALQGNRLTDDERAKLELIVEARAYARDVIGLTVNDNYTMFFNSEGLPVAYNVSACRKDAFVPATWTFPIVGTIPYLGYFSEPAANMKLEALQQAGYDTFRYEIDAYSGLAFFPSIILSPMLNRGDGSLVETVFHELLHSTIWRADATSFNESLATFVGRTAAVEFLGVKFPDDPDYIAGLLQRFEDSDRYNAFMLTLFEELDAYYGSDASSEEKIAGRDAKFAAGWERFEQEVRPLMNNPENYAWVVNTPSNNAWMMTIRRYNLDLDVFERVHEATNQDWSASLALFRAAAGSGNPYAYLETWLDGDQTLPQKRDASQRKPVERSYCPQRLPWTIFEVE